jgi:hypothetical protein
MASASFWLSYYSGAIKATLVLACILGAVLVGVVGLSLLQGLLIATATAIAISGGLAVLQRRLIDRRIRSTRVVVHPDLGRIHVWRDHWDAEVHPSDLPYSCGVSGVSSSGIPTQEQISLWRTILGDLQPLLAAAHRTLVADLRSNVPPAQELRLAAIKLLQPDAFVIFLLHEHSKHQGFFVRYENMSVVEAGRAPWRRPRGTREG